MSLRVFLLLFATGLLAGCACGFLFELRWGQAARVPAAVPDAAAENRSRAAREELAAVRALENIDEGLWTARAGFIERYPQSWLGRVWGSRWGR